MHILHNYSLKSLNTFGLDSLAKQFIILNNVSQLETIATILHNNNLNYFVLGGGSNVILPPLYNGYVIHNCLYGIEMLNQDDNFYYVNVRAGENWDNFVAITLNNKWYGLENLSLIPGTVGATPIQNIGAYGVEVKDFIASVEVFDLQDNCIKHISNSECQFSYRHSIFKTTNRFIVISVVFKLLIQAKLVTSYGDLATKLATITNFTASDLRQAVISIRQQKLPDPKIIGNVGSFFHNPILENFQVMQLKQLYPNLPVYPLDNNRSKVSAGWLIDNLGLKGFKLGNVGVYAKQALVLVNYAAATQNEIINFATMIQDKVYQQYQIQLNIEPIIMR
ncbi:MAG: UDP-N-acetylmuramate dehydrogenase [Burkholderiales bacterium]|nr:UDP-N-acetylmuramate dehydrogenase [Burkholderiales bacterium]